MPLIFVHSAEVVLVVHFLLWTICGDVCECVCVDSQSARSYDAMQKNGFNEEIWRNKKNKMKRRWWKSTCIRNNNLLLMCCMNINLIFRKNSHRKFGPNSLENLFNKAPLTSFWLIKWVSIHFPIFQLFATHAAGSPHIRRWVFVCLHTCVWWCIYTLGLSCETLSTNLIQSTGNIESYWIFARTFVIRMPLCTHFRFGSKRLIKKICAINFECQTYSGTFDSVRPCEFASLEFILLLL